MYDQIIAIIRQGRVPIVKDRDGDYAACIFEKDGEIFATTWRENIDDIFDSNGGIRHKDTIIIDNRQIVRVDDRQKNEYKAGDLVDLDLEALEKTSDWNYYKKYYGDGKGLLIDDIYYAFEGLGYGIKTKDKSNRYTIGYEYLRPYYPQQDDEVQKAIKLLEEKGLLVNGKILK